MGRVKGGLKALLSSSILCLSLLSGSGCNSGASSESVVTGGLGEQVVQEQGQAVFTLVSTLNNAPVVAKDVSTATSSIRVRSTKSSGEQVVSQPVEVAAVISVKIPTDSTQVQIDYLDSDEKVREIWGGQLPPLPTGSEFIVRNPNPDPTSGVVKVEISGPTTAPFAIPTQYRATATYESGEVRDVTNSATFLINNRAGLMVGGVLGESAQARLGVSSVRIAASFGDRTSSPLLARFTRATPSGNPFFSDATGQFQVGAVELESFGARAQMRAFSDFTDGIRREVTLALAYTTTPTGIVEVNTLGQITGFDAGVATLQGLFNFRGGSAAQVAVTVLRGFLETMYSKNAVLPNTVTGLSSVYALGDINGDGRTDIVGVPGFFTNEELPPEPDFSRVAIYLGNGDGTFQDPTGSPLVMPLPFTDASEGFVRLVTVGNRTYAAVGVVGSSQLALVAGPTLTARRQEIPASVTEVALTDELFKLMSMSDGSGGLLIQGGRGNVLTSVVVSGPSSRDANMPRFSLSTVPYSLIEEGDYVECRGDYLFHHRLNSSRLDILKVVARPGRTVAQRVKSIPLESQARVVDVQLGPVTTTVVNRRTSEFQPALIAVRGLNSAPSNGSNCLLVNNLQDGNEFEDGIPLAMGDLAPSTLSAMFLEAANRRTPSLMITGEKLFDGVAIGGVSALGVTVPAIGGTTLRTTDISSLPGTSFGRFEVGDVTGDGTSDIVSWENGIITVIRLAAFDHAL